MFPLLGLALMIGVGALCLKCTVNATNALSANRRAVALLWATPVLILAGLIAALLQWGDYSSY